MNAIISFCLKHVNLLNEFKNPKNILSFETLFKVINNRKKIFEKEINDMALILWLNRPVFKKKTRILIQNCNMLNKKIHEYYIHKYSAVLLKTNRDIFRIVISFLE
jgi:hypothetical protein